MSAYNHPLTLKKAADALLSAGKTYGFYEKQSDEAASKLVVLLDKECYKAFGVMHLLTNVNNYGVHGPHVDDNKVSEPDCVGASFLAVCRAMTRANGLGAFLSLIGRAERPYFNCTPPTHE